MKYELETIPIWDAYDLEGECPLCHLQERAEKEYQDFFLGNSVMIPEMRVKVNAVGFCPEHYSRLFSSRKNRHGLGLVTHTHLKTQKEALETLQNQVKRHWNKGVTPQKQIRQQDTETDQQSETINGRKGKQQTLKKYTDTLKNAVQGCMICERVEYTLRRYAFTIIYLWKKNLEFYDRYNESKGFCLAHLPLIMELAGANLNNRQFTLWLSETIALQEKAMERLEGEVLWYTQKYDFQNDGKPWGTSKDALERVIQKLTGIIQKEPES